MSMSQTAQGKHSGQKDWNPQRPKGKGKHDSLEEKKRKQKRKASMTPFGFWEG